MILLSNYDIMLSNENLFTWLLLKIHFTAMELTPILITHEQEAKISNFCCIKLNKWVYYWDPGEKFTEQKGKLGGTIGSTKYECDTIAQYIFTNMANLVPIWTTTKHIPLRHMKTFDDVIYAKLGDLITLRGAKEELMKWTPYEDAEETPHSFPVDDEITFDFCNVSVRLVDDLTNSEVLLYQGENMDGCTGPKVVAKVVRHLNKANCDTIGKPNENPSLNTVMYEVELRMELGKPYAENIIVHKIYYQVNSHDRKDITLNGMID